MVFICNFLLHSAKIFSKNHNCLNFEVFSYGILQKLWISSGFTPFLKATKIRFMVEFFEVNVAETSSFVIKILYCRCNLFCRYADLNRRIKVSGIT